MKRKTQLKRTPLKRGTKQIAKRSKKTEDKYVDRRKVVAQLLFDFPLCFACPVFAKHDGKIIYVQSKSVDVHEIVRRSQGGSILDLDNLVTVCRMCHIRIGNEPELAFLLGLSKHSWD